VGNADFVPTADFVTDRDVRFDADTQGKRLTAAVKSYDAMPAQNLAVNNLGDAIYGNMIMLGFAWQKGVIPVSSRALYRAIRLNGVDAEANLQAFELGRKATADPTFRGKREDDVPTPETMGLDELIAHRTQELTAYQSGAYARRYAERVAQARAAEAPLGSEALTRAVAVNLYKLMAYKDEYEVARLYTDGRFQAYRDATFKGGKAKVWLAPPLIARKGKDGRPQKIAFSGWMLDAAFPMMAKMKGLRGTALDIFGYTDERKMERRLIADYEAALARIVSGLSSERLATAVQIAALPQKIRGYGHIKEASVAPAKAEEKALWGRWDKQAAKALATA
jgi:indolepyruvate ferredoxin oxidoreductase